MAYMSREERKDQILLAMLDALDYKPGMRLIGGRWINGIKRPWTVSEIAHAIDMRRSTRLHQMMDELVQEGSLHLSYEPYKPGGVIHYRKVYQIVEEAYIQQPMEAMFQ